MKRLILPAVAMFLILSSLSVASFAAPTPPTLNLETKIGGVIVSPGAIIAVGTPTQYTATFTNNSPNSQGVFHVDVTYDDAGTSQTVSVESAVTLTHPIKPMFTVSPPPNMASLKVLSITGDAVNATASVPLAGTNGPFLVTCDSLPGNGGKIVVTYTGTWG